MRQITAAERQLRFDTMESLLEIFEIFAGQQLHIECLEMCSSQAEAPEFIVSITDYGKGSLYNSSELWSQRGANEPVPLSQIHLVFDTAADALGHAVGLAGGIIQH